jgi:hypothetical protein
VFEVEVVDGEVVEDRPKQEGCRAGSLRDKTWKARNLEQAGWIGDETASASKGKTLRARRLCHRKTVRGPKKTETINAESGWFWGTEISLGRVRLEEQENPMRGATVEEANYRIDGTRL